MPMPPILETIDWKMTFNEGLEFAAWLEQAKDDKRESITEQLNKLNIPNDAAAQITAITKRVHVIAIAEDWCGDVVRHVPVLEKLAEHSDFVQTRYITREAYKHIFARYLTNGGEAIPKFIFLNEDFVECGNWGPMPQLYKDLISRGKACDDVATARKIIHDAYTQGEDRAPAIAELTKLFATAGADSVT